LVQVVNWLVTLATQGIIEFVPKNDPMVQELLSLRQDIFPDYTAEHFMALLKEKAVIIKNKTVSKSGRLLCGLDACNSGKLNLIKLEPEVEALKENLWCR
jgi:hypothetical protein